VATRDISLSLLWRIVRRANDHLRIGAALAQRMAGSDFNRRAIIAASDLAGGIALAHLESSWRGS
jgi:hypothetical protein